MTDNGLIRSVAEFAEVLNLPSGHGPKKLTLDDWQREDFQAMDPAIDRLLVRGNPQDCINRFWLERSRGHSKTMDIAIVCSYLLMCAPRPIFGVAAAADKDQAKLLRDAIALITQFNPAVRLEVQQYRVRNKDSGSELLIMSNDVASSYGQTCDFIVVDEVSHWSSRDLFDSMLSTAAKRANCLFVSILNAGWRDTWQWQVREAVRTDPSWYFSQQDGPVASWINQAALAEQQRLLPPSVYSRLWGNAWQDGAGDAIDQSLIDAAIDDTLHPMAVPEPGFTYVGGLDLGISRDHSALCIVGLHTGHTESIPTGRAHWSEWGEQIQEFDHVTHAGDRSIRLAYTRSWKPPAGGKIQLEQVEREVASAAKLFGVQQIFFDPWQCQLMAERLRRQGLMMSETTFTANNLQSMATALLESFSDKRVKMYRDERLIADLKRLRVVERPYGCRLESPKDGDGHGDLATAFSLSLLGAANAKPQVDLMAWLNAGAF